MDIQTMAMHTQTAAKAGGSELGQIASAMAPGGAMGKEEFLKLLVTQLKNQDPLEPQDSSQMVAELAQFSALEQMQNLNEEFTGYRQDNGALMSFLMSGTDVVLQMNDGSTVSGRCDNVRWDENGETLISVNSIYYSLADVLSVAKQ